MKKRRWIFFCMLCVVYAEAKIEQNRYIQHTDGRFSTISIGCEKDTECVLVDTIQRGCSHLVSVHKGITQKQIRLFNRQEAPFWVNKDVQCSYPTEAVLKHLVPRCKKGVCSVGVKK